MFYKKGVKKLANLQKKNSFFNSEYCKIFKSIYFEEHLQMATSENVFMKMRKNKNCSYGIFNLILKNQVKMFFI